MRKASNRQTDETEEESELFRPLIYESQLQRIVKYKTNNTSQIAVVPYSFFPHVVVDRGSADPRVFRPSLLVLPQTINAMGTIGLPLGGVLCPLYNSNQSSNQQQPGQQLKDEQHWRCRCGMYYCPSSIVKNERVYCNNCKTSKVSASDVPEKLLSKGVVDLVVKHQPITIYYIVVFEMSKIVMESRYLYTMLEAVLAAINSILETTVRFVFIGHTPNSIYSYAFNTSTQQLSVSICKEFDQLFVGIDHLSCPIQQCEGYLTELIDHLQSVTEEMPNQEHDHLPDILALLVRTQPSLLKKILVLSSKGQFTGEYATGNTASTSGRFESPDNCFKNIGHIMNDSGNNTTMDWFCVVESGRHIQFEEIKHPFMLSGGTVNLYLAADNPSALYYDVYRCVTRLTVFKVQIRCITGPGLKVGSLAFGHYVKHKSKVDLNSLNEDSTLVVLLQMCEKQFRYFRTNLQFIVGYFDGRTHRKRIINYSLYRCNTNENHQVMAGIDPEASARVLLTELAVYKHHTKNISLARERLVQALGKLREFYLTVNYKIEVDEKNPKALELAQRYEENMGLFACHAFSLLHRYGGLTVSVDSLHTWKAGYEEMRMLTSSVEETSKMLYPRVYQLLWNSLSDKVDYIYMGGTIYSDSTVLEEESVVVVDNGWRLYIFNNLKSPDKTELLFGTTHPPTIESLSQIQPISKQAQTLAQFTDDLRNRVRGGCLAIDCIASLQKFNRHEEQLFVENSYRKDGSDNYSRFLRRYTEQ